MPAAGDVVTPFAFGAKGDGATDDTAASEMPELHSFLATLA